MSFGGWGWSSGAGAPYSGWGWPSGGGAPYSGVGDHTSLLTPTVVDARDAYPDNGGVVITLAANWLVRGPYFVRLVDGDGDVWPRDRNAYSGRLGQTDACFTDTTMETLAFVLPAAPPGTYAIRLKWGANAALTTTLANAIVIQRRMRPPAVYRLRTGLPELYPLGARRPDDEPPDAPFDLPTSPLRALTDAVGDALGQLTGRPTTRLSADVAPDDTTLHVESTIDLPEVGAVFVHGVRMTYTGRTATTLTGAASATPRFAALPTGSAVTLDLGSTQGDARWMPTVERMFRETTIRHAGESGFDSLAAMYGLARPPSWNLEAWRNGVWLATWAPRGTLGCLFGFLEQVLTPHHEVVTVQRDPAQPTKLLPAPGESFAQRHVGRLVRIGAGLYCTVGPADVDAAGGAYLTLCPWSTPYWQAAGWATLPDVAIDEATFLAFALAEPSPGYDARADAGLACKVIITLFGSAIGDVPPTFWVDDGAARPADEPYGGHVLVDEWSAGDQVDGPFPLYFDSGDGVLGACGVVLKNLCVAGVHPVGRPGVP